MCVETNFLDAFEVSAKLMSQAMWLQVSGKGKEDRLLSDVYDQRDAIHSSERFH